MIPIVARAKVVNTVVPPTGWQLSAHKREAAFRFFSGNENILSSNIFKAVADVYRIQPNPDDYLFLVARCLTADVPNNNGDCFPEPELLRFDPQRNCVVYQTFQNAPLHLNHKAEDRTKALGFLPDVHFNRDAEDDHFVEALVAVDRVKNKQIAAELESGKRNEFSMGCLASKVECSICASVAATEEELCHHLRYHKGQRDYRGPETGWQPKHCFERCFGVTYTELSVVDDAADRTAVTQALLGKLAASRQRSIVPFAQAAAQRARNAPLLDSLDLSAASKFEIAAFFEISMGGLNEGMVELAEKLFGASGAA